MVALPWSAASTTVPISDRCSSVWRPPSTGWNEPHWRGLQQSWLLELIKKTGGAVRKPCGPELPFSDTFAEVDWVVSWESL